jgi:hypothetical protein
MKSSNILTRENESSSIEKLAAQRELYSRAKVLFYVQTFITVISLVLLSFSQLVFPKLDFTLAIATVSLLAIIADYLFEKHIADIKETAAKIQELFDTYVLNINWNGILCLAKPEYNEIFQNYSKHKSKRRDFSQFTNWYEPDIIRVTEQTGKLICQKTNCNYDSNIRKKYNGVIVFIGASTILLIFIFTVFSDITLSKLLLTVIFPSVPIIQWTHKNVLNNNDSIKNLEQLNNLLNSTWNDLKNGIQTKDEVIRQIQDGIYLNRKGSPLIPDFIYDKLRNKLELETYYSVAQLVNEINLT